MFADGMLHWAQYIARTFDGVAHSSHLRSDNYFYYNCCTGRFLKDCCPSYLTREGFNRLKSGRLESLHIVSSYFKEQLQARMYSKVILMDHVDWQDLTAAKDLAQVLARQVIPGGRVIWRSAAEAPKYAQLVREAGFDVKCLQRAEEGYMDRVNMYSSFYVAVRRGSSHLANGSSHIRRAS
ncbi:hypothetical protein WJX84_003123 [Apatococcus fuscideae]|uniref:Uncharacterized protein n=1 Tax=Apatococcus fuscideae TaxID=2026836 RepID=A0AAW1RPI8_9CHLO